MRDEHATVGEHQRRDGHTAIRTLGAKRQTNATETIRRAVSTYKFLHDAQQRGDTIRLTDGREITEVKLL